MICTPQRGRSWGCGEVWSSASGRSSGRRSTPRGTTSSFISSMTPLKLFSSCEKESRVRRLEFPRIVAPLAAPDRSWNTHSAPSQVGKSGPASAPSHLIHSRELGCSKMFMVSYKTLERSMRRQSRLQTQLAEIGGSSSPLLAGSWPAPVVSIRSSQHPSHDLRE